MTSPSPTPPLSPIVIRGKVIDSNPIRFGGRGGDFEFLSPDPARFARELPLASPKLLGDLYALRFDDILDFLIELGGMLHLDRNAHLQQALDLSYHTAPVTPPLLEAQYQTLPVMFERGFMREMTEKCVGVDYLEGWVQETLRNGRVYESRAFGARTVHVVAGNSPIVSALSIIRNAVLRSDAIIKSPSNDPFTALAIARTMVELDPNHPITRHLSVAYWRGGDVEFEKNLYQPHNVEKIIAWGGFSGMKHITQYIQPGLELISLDPKRSASIVGAEVFDSEADMREAAVRIATDMGVTNQNGCVCSRLAYVMTGSDDEGVANANRFGEMIYDALMGLPAHISTKPKSYSRELKSHVEALRMQEDWYAIVGGEDDEGAIIVSQMPEQIDFIHLLGDRTLNVVPVDSLDDIYGAVDAYTQTVGVYPETLKDQVKDQLPLYGAQRIVSLGYAGQGPDFCGPHDSIEPMRRMCKWIINEISSPETVPPMWTGANILNGVA